MASSRSGLFFCLWLQTIWFKIRKTHRYILMAFPSVFQHPALVETRWGPHPWEVSNYCCLCKKWNVNFHDQSRRHQRYLDSWIEGNRWPLLPPPSPPPPPPPPTTPSPTVPSVGTRPLKLNRVTIEGGESIERATITACDLKHLANWMNSTESVHESTWMQHMTNADAAGAMSEDTVNAIHVETDYVTPALCPSSSPTIFYPGGSYAAGKVIAVTKVPGAHIGRSGLGPMSEDISNAVPCGAMSTCRRAGWQKCGETIWV